jgi:RNA-directed DNA polymerase
LHPEKTRIVYCKDDDRKGNYPNISFDFLGFTFRPREAKSRWGRYFTSFLPAISNKAAKAIRQEIKSLKIHRRSGSSLEDLSRMCNPKIRGWINYYGSFYKTALYPILNHINRILTKWVTWKFKRFKGHRKQAAMWLGRVAHKQPLLFAHWQMGLKPATGR